MHGSASCGDSVRKTCLDMVYELAKTDERIFFIGSDLGAGTLDAFKQEMPERFFMEGVSEAHLVGMSAGLALEGKIPYVNTIASFITRRCFEQVALDLCLHHARVRLIGNGGGLVYAPLGPTHTPIEDMAIMRALPNMTILAPADALEMRRIMPLTVEHEGPIYIRLAKGGDPIVTREDWPLAIGQAILARRGTDALIVTTGITLKIGLDAAMAMESGGLEVGVLHLPTIKPLDRDRLLATFAPIRAIVTVEEHSIIGGLGSAVAEVIAEAAFDPGKRFLRIGVPDVFPDEYESQESSLRHHGITTELVVTRIRELLEPSVRAADVTSVATART